MKFTSSKLAASILFVVGLFVAPSLACSFFAIPKPPVEYIVSRTDHIFVGTLLEKTTRSTGLVVDDSEIRSLLFRIDRSLKGQKTGTYRIEYRVKIDGETCGEEPPNPSIGEKWTMFDGYRERGNTRPNVMSQGFSSEKFTSEKSDNFEGIRRAVREPSSTFYGQVQGLMGGFIPLDTSVLSVELRSKDGVKLLESGKINKEHFAFRDLAPGEYVIRIRSSKPHEVLTLGSDKLNMVAFEGGYKCDYPLTIQKNEPEFKLFILGRFEAQT
jgi:hypothetical protein